MRYTSAILFSLQASAFPFVVEELGKRQVPSTAAARALSKARSNCGNIPCLTFDEKDQLVDVTGEHAWAAPKEDEIRGPCPGLNAAANHGYLSRSGVTTLLESITGLGGAFAMGPVLSGFLAAYAVIMTGDPLTLSWSIGGPPPSNPLTKGLLGQPQGISWAHNTYESDMSVARCDAYLNNGDAHSLDIQRFKALYETGMKEDRYTMDLFAQEFEKRGQQSVAQNPYFFSGPFSGILVAPAAYMFVINLMSNHSHAEPNGWLDGKNLKQFFAVTGDYPNFKWERGHERIPENWYRRPTAFPYDAQNVDSDVAVQYSAYPESLRLGGNTNGVNSYSGVDLGNITGGVLNAEYLFNTANPKGSCFWAQLAQAAIPDSANLLANELSAITSLLNDHVLNLITHMDCPKVDKFDQNLFNKFPGHKYSPTGGASNW